MDPYEQLLNVIGFPAADAAASINRAGRDRERGQYDVRLAGDEERRGINAGLEERGLLGGGTQGMALARQAGREARDLTDLDIGFADVVSDAQRDITRSLGMEDARRRELEAARNIREGDYQAELGLIRSGGAADLESAMRQWNIDMSAIDAAARNAAAQQQSPTFDPGYLGTILSTLGTRESRTGSWRGW